MRRSTWMVAMGAMLAVVASQATFAGNAQTEKMTTCSADAKTKALAGEERKAFMKTCLSNHPAPAPKMNSQQEKMKSCNADATTKALKGAARKSFMSDCLKSGSTLH